MSSFTGSWIANRERPFVPESSSGVNKRMRNGAGHRRQYFAPHRAILPLHVVRRKQLAYTRLLTDPRRIAGAKSGGGAIREVGGRDGGCDRARCCRRVFETRDSSDALTALSAGLGACDRSAAVRRIQIH